MLVLLFLMYLPSREDLGSRAEANQLLVFGTIFNPSR